jgi:hypothetical protein
MSTLLVGKDKKFQTIAAAVAAAQDGDTIRVDGGRYLNDFPPVIRVSLKFEAVGSRVVMEADKPIPNGKGLIIAGGTNTNPTISFDAFDFVGAQVRDKNGAGIRYQAGDLTCTNCVFRNCQDGILATPLIKGIGTIVIDRCEIDGCGAGDGQSHNLYIGFISNFALTNSYSHDCKVGHLVKTRAKTSTITNCRLFDNGQTSSYAVDCPNAGDLFVSNCQIQQGAKGQNPFFSTYGVGDSSNPGRTAHITSCVVVNDAKQVKLMYNAVTDTPAVWTDCQFWGVPDTLVARGRGLVTVNNPTWLTARPLLDIVTPPYGPVATHREEPDVGEDDDDFEPPPDQQDPEPDDDTC